MFESLSTIAVAPTQPRAVLARLLPAAAAALLGLVLIYGIALAQPLVLHNATHDTRHSLGFPCH